MDEKQKLLERSRPDDRATALVRRHFAAIDASWQRNRGQHDLIGLLRVEEDGSMFLGMSHRQEKIEQSPELLKHFPQIAQSAWEAKPQLAVGTAMWLIVGVSPPFWTCMRVHKTTMVQGGRA